MNHMYPIHIHVEEEVLNNNSQFNKQTKRKIQQDGVILIITKCKESINQQVEFLHKNNSLKLTYYPCCKERWFETELEPGTSMCARYDQSKKSPKSF